MWIRSQDGKILCKCEEVYLGNHYDYYKIENDKWVLGEYSTEKKAIKVLDMIEKWINNFSCSSIVSIPVFQMPKNDEV